MDRFGTEQAEAYAAGFWKIVAFLAEFPRAARQRDELGPPVRAYPYRSHLIVYDVDYDDGIVILRVPHGREDWSGD